MKITREQLLRFFDEDEPEDIANYMADHINDWIEKPDLVKHFVSGILEEQDEEEIKEPRDNSEKLSLLKRHFGLKDNEVLNSDHDIDPEEYSICINGKIVVIQLRILVLIFTINLLITMNMFGGGYNEL